MLLPEINYNDAKFNNKESCKKYIEALMLERLNGELLPDPSTTTGFHYAKPLWKVETDSGHDSTQQSSQDEMVNANTMVQQQREAELSYDWSETRANVANTKQCQICGREFSTIFACKRHEKNVHSQREPCHHCGMLLKINGRKDALMRHMKRCVKKRGQ
eukprot:NODE_430_length_7576_cov_0.738665.p5 type:complete len:160 gc:universal NODE_430_length_7576_cov_0.738665:102-581(+)